MQSGHAGGQNYARNSPAADEVVRQIRAAGGTAMAVQADVAVEADILARDVCQSDAKLGPLSALVNNVPEKSIVDGFVEALSTRMQHWLPPTCWGWHVPAKRCAA